MNERKKTCVVITQEYEKMNHRSVFINLKV